MLALPSCDRKGNSRNLFVTAQYMKRRTALFELQPLLFNESTRRSSRQFLSESMVSTMVSTPKQLCPEIVSRVGVTFLSGNPDRALAQEILTKDVFFLSTLN